MKKKIIIAALIAGAFSFYIYHLNIDNACYTVVKIYTEKIRASLFTGFLTLGGFLLSLKTFIIVKMKESVYDSSEYKEYFENRKERNSSLSLYKPLQNLSHLLFWAILSAIITSILQFSIGFFENVLSTMICIYMAAFTIILLILSLFEIKKNLDSWFHITENKKTKKE